VAELVDARDLKSLDGNVVWVRVPPPAPIGQRIPFDGRTAGLHNARDTRADLQDFFSAQTDVNLPALRDLLVLRAWLATRELLHRSAHALPSIEFGRSAAFQIASRCSRALPRKMDGLRGRIRDRQKYQASHTERPGETAPRCDAYGLPRFHSLNCLISTPDDAGKAS
jgi:hypothetical protein